MEKYCGNNALYSGLINGTHRIGSNYECLKTGIGIGLNLPLDPSYQGQFQPIDQTNIYCGTRPILPAGYDRLGTPPICLQKGVGVGKSLNNRGIISQNYNFFLVYILGLIILFLLLYFNKPSFVTKKINNENKIDWYKFIFSYILIYIVYIIIMVLFINII